MAPCRAAPRFARTEDRLLVTDGAVNDEVTFADDLDFLRMHTEVIVLSHECSQARVAIVPAWQGRVMTSTVGPGSGPSFGWVNRALISSGKVLEQINAFGGEDR